MVTRGGPDTGSDAWLIHAPGDGRADVRRTGYGVRRMAHVRAGGGGRC